MSARLRTLKNELKIQKSVQEASEPKKYPKRLPRWKDRNIFFSILAFRLLNAFTTKTFIQADEFFQLLEPAHQLVFGYGLMSWEWKEKLRPSIHQLIVATVYKRVWLLGLADRCEK